MAWTSSGLYSPFLGMCLSSKGFSFTSFSRAEKISVKVSNTTSGSKAVINWLATRGQQHMKTSQQIHGCRHMTTTAWWPSSKRWVFWDWPSLPPIIFSASSCSSSADIKCEESVKRSVKVKKIFSLYNVAAFYDKKIYLFSWLWTICIYANESLKALRSNC